jgi:hypothetical protein
MSFASKNPALAVGIAGASLLLIPVLVRHDVGKSLDAAFEGFRTPKDATKSQAKEENQVGALILMGRRRQRRDRKW